MKVTTGQKVVCGFGLGLVLLMALGWFSLQTAREFIASAESRKKCLDARALVARFLASLNNAETGQRGFLLTADDRYLEPYRDALPALSQQLDELSALARDDAALQQICSPLPTLVDRKILEMASTIEARKGNGGHGFDAALEIVRSDRGKRLMDEIREVVARVSGHVESIDERMVRQASANASQLIAIICLVTPVSLLLVSCAGWLILRDLSARTRAEMEIRRHRALLETILASIGEGIIVADERGRFAVFNPMAYRILGVRPTADCRGNWSSTFGLYCTDKVTPFPENDLPLARALCGESTDNVEMCVCRGDGEETRFISVTGRPIADAAGMLHGGVVVFHDITDRKRAEQDLRLSEERFRLIVDAVKDYGIFMLNPEGYVATWNAGAQRIKGYAANEIIGEHFARFYTQTDLEAGKPNRDLRSAAINGRIEDEGWRVRKDGVQFWANTVITAMRNESGELIGFSKITRDLTERKRTEEALAATAETLRRSNKELEQFAYVASHDLKEPLRMVASYTRLLAEECEGKLGEEAQKYIKYAIDGAKRMQSLIDDLLTYSRLGRTPEKNQTVDLKSVVETARLNLERLIETTGAALEVGELPCVEGNPTLLAQLVQNLIGNAIKFHGNEPPVVRVSCTRRDNEWQFAIEDNGIGIAPEHHGRVFEIFQRLHGRGAYEGTGIGLSICRKIVEQHGGSIWIDSEVGRGSTFYFTLPVSHSPTVLETEAVLA